MNPSAQSPSPPLQAVLAQAARLMDANEETEAIAALLSVPELVRGHPVASSTLAYLLLTVDRPREAIGWFEAVLALKPGDAQSLAGLGMACQGSGEILRAVKCYDAALTLRGNDAGLWYHLGSALFELGRLRDSLLCLDRAIELHGAYALAHSRRSAVLEAMADLAGAVTAAVRACEISPDVDALLQLGNLLSKQNKSESAIAIYDMVLAQEPQNFYGLCNKAQALKQAERGEEALAHVRAALEAQPDNCEALLLRGTLEHDLGHAEAAIESLRRVAEQGPARRYKAIRNPARFKALLLFSPLAGNTPYEDLIVNGGYDADVVLVLPGYDHDPAALDAGADVIVNLVSDADLGREIIGPLAAFADRLTKPVVNHPRLILPTDRQSIARRLKDLPGAVMPSTTRIAAPLLARQMQTGTDIPLPLIVRHAGTHGGDRMELLHSPAEILAFAEEAGDEALYLTHYVDYRSADGLFRKYRFIFAGEDILPYHLAVGDGWKVHHASTRMAEFEWMRAEEAAFLDAPEQRFGPQAMATLDSIRRRIGLDYFGIDCALDPEGRVLIFEVNASMLIHLHNEGFDYKTPHVMRIKAAFEEMLAQRAREGGADAPAAAASGRSVRRPGAA
jgi:tetratricopeptide (TPR) repeat protein